MDNIYYRITNFQLNQFATFEDKFQQSKEITINSNFGLAYNSGARTIRSTICIDFLQNEEMIMKVELSTFIEIKEESVNSLIKGNKLVLSPNLQIQFSSFGYGALRGIMYLKTINTPFANIILPPIEVSEMFKDPIEFEISIKE
jgi:hypothetical protein